MKKKVLLALLLAAGLVAVSPVSAMTEAELKEKLTKEYVVNGVKVKASQKQVEEIEKYLEEFEVTADDADIIAMYVDKAVEEVKASGATSWAELEKKGTVTKLADIANQVSTKTSVSVSLSKSGSLTVLNPVTGAVWATTGINDTKITNTDDSMAAVIAYGAAISLVGLLIVTKKVVKANA